MNRHSIPIVRTDPEISTAVDYRNQTEPFSRPSPSVRRPAHRTSCW